MSVVDFALFGFTAPTYHLADLEPPTPPSTSTTPLPAQSTKPLIPTASPHQQNQQNPTPDAVVSPVAPAGQVAVIRKRRTEVEMLKALWRSLPYWNKRKRNGSDSSGSRSAAAAAIAPKPLPSHWGSMYLTELDGKQVRRSRRINNQRKLLTAG
jgi:hypothetical protein